MPRLVPYASRALSVASATRRQERRAGQAIGAEPVRGSGNQENRRGDLQADRFLCESKRTRGARLSITLTMVRKIEREAQAVGKLPCLLAELQPRGSHVDGERLLVLPLWVAREIGLRPKGY